MTGNEKSGGDFSGGDSATPSQSPRHPRPAPSGVAMPRDMVQGFAPDSVGALPAAGDVTLDDRGAWAVLDTVPDPEIPSVSLVDLGVIRGVEMHDDQVRVRMTPTYTGCPATDLMQVLVRDRLLDAGFPAVEIDLQLSPAWSSDEITEQGHRRLAAAGIAPPAFRTADKRHLAGDAPVVACPRCGSADTVMTSAFGATACKALYRCNACDEPFDYFKCI